VMGGGGGGVGVVVAVVWVLTAALAWFAAGLGWA
jgi:hypothetical protein